VIAESIAVIRDGWSSLFQILSPVNYDGDPDILQTSFGVLTLICNDRFSCVVQNSLPSCIEIIFRFAGADSDINLSLSAFDLLWVAVRGIEHNAENWTTLLTELLKLSHDERSDVAQCAIRTFFSLVSSHFEQIPPVVVSYLIDAGFPDLITRFKQPSRFPDLELVLGELAHYTATFWDMFSTRETFLTKYLPLLIEKEHWFVLNCPDWELVTHSFQFYECLFTCPHLAPEIERLMRESIYAMHDAFLMVTDNSCIVFASFGRLMERIIQSVKTRNCVETVELWFPLIRKTVANLKSVTFIHLTPQRTLEGLTLIGPMPEEILFKVVALLMEFIAFEDQPCLGDYIGFILTTIYDQEVSDELRVKFIVACTSFFEHRCAEGFMKSILATNPHINGTPSAALFHAFSLMAVTCPALEETVNSQMLQFFDKASRDDQLAFVKRNCRKLDILILLWSQFFVPPPPTFCESVFENCFDAVLQAMADLMVDPDWTEHVLQFFQDCHVPVKEVKGATTEKWFLLRIIPVLVQLIQDGSPAVRESVQVIMTSLAPLASSSG
jgi:hypothetical protein